MTDVCAAMQLFRQQSIPPSAVSSDIPQAMVNAVKELYAHAQSLALDAVSAERKALDDAQTALNLFRAEIEELAADVEREREEAMSAASAAAVRADASGAEVNVCRGRIAQLEELLERKWGASGVHGKVVGVKERRGSE